MQSAAQAWALTTRNVTEVQQRNTVTQGPFVIVTCICAGQTTAASPSTTILRPIQGPDSPHDGD